MNEDLIKDLTDVLNKYGYDIKDINMNSIIYPNDLAKESQIRFDNASGNKGLLSVRIV